MATKVKTPKKQEEPDVGQADIDRAMIDKRNKDESATAGKFGLGDSPSKDFSGSDYYKGKKAGGSCKGYAKGGSVKSSASSRGDGCATKGRTKGRII
jgi:hypothetical protein